VAVQRPGEGELCGGAAFAAGQIFDVVEEGEVLREVFALETRTRKMVR
jgi:hypothetical protein